MSLDINRFSKTVDRVSRIFAEDTQAREDLQQEFWVKLLEIMPKLKAVSEDEVLIFAFTSLRNCGFDIVRHRGRDPTKTSYDCEGAISVDDLVRSSYLSLSDVINHDLNNPHAYTSYRELCARLLEWASTQGEFVSMLTREFVQPSQKVHDTWARLSETKPSAFKNLDYLPACSYAEVLGVPQQRVKRALKKIRKFLLDSRLAPEFA